MSAIYTIIGMLVFWGVILAVASFLIYILYRKCIRRIIKSDNVNYYLLRKPIDSGILRDYYSAYSEFPHLKKWILKYRLRNIKKATALPYPYPLT